ncbi:MAG: macrolide ABC transporter ATP-binding protein [Dehalococcoidia bacterium]
MPLRLRGVSHRYGPSMPWVVRGIDLEIGDGELVALMGPSGSGKTTLLSILGLLTRPAEGEVLLDGEPVPGRMAAERRTTEFAWVFQTANALLRRTALENASLQLLARGAARQSAHAVAAAELERVGVGHLAARPARLLSGGELQRVCIARALAAAPRWILADEPTGQLDHATTLEVSAALMAGRPIGTGVIIATHDPEVAHRCGRVIRLVDGAVVAGGGG